MTDQTRYILIKPDEDGNPISWLTDEDMQNIVQLMEDYGVHEWITDKTDPNYWKEGQAMLLKVDIANPHPVQVIEKWELP